MTDDPTIEYDDSELDEDEADEDPLPRVLAALVFMILFSVIIVFISR